MNALISVPDGKSVIPLALALYDSGLDIIATEQTGMILREAGISCSLTREPLHRLFYKNFEFIIVGLNDDASQIDRLDFERCALITLAFADRKSTTIVADRSEYNTIIEELGSGDTDHMLSNATRDRLASKAMSVIVSQWTHRIGRSIRQQNSPCGQINSLVGS